MSRRAPLLTPRATRLLALTPSSRRWHVPLSSPPPRFLLPTFVPLWARASPALNLIAATSSLGSMRKQEPSLGCEIITYFPQVSSPCLGNLILFPWSLLLPLPTTHHPHHLCTCHPFLSTPTSFLCPTHSPSCSSPACTPPICLADGPHLFNPCISFLPSTYLSMVFSVPSFCELQYLLSNHNHCV